MFWTGLGRESSRKAISKTQQNPQQGILESLGFHSTQVSHLLDSKGQKQVGTTTERRQGEELRAPTTEDSSSVKDAAVQKQSLSESPDFPWTWQLYMLPFLNAFPAYGRWDFLSQLQCL